MVAAVEEVAVVSEEEAEVGVPVDSEVEVEVCKNDEIIIT